MTSWPRGCNSARTFDMLELGRRLLDPLPTVVGHTPGPRGKHPAHPAGLSECELEVLCLVAQGRTNREDRAGACPE